MPSLPNPLSLGLAARQARARQLRAHDDLIVEVLNTDAQHVEGVVQHLGLGRQAIEAEAQRHWPQGSWESTSTGGPPRRGDLHAKVASVIDDGGNAVALDVRLSRMEVDTETEDNVYDLAPFGDVVVPLALVPALVVALQQQLAYWDANPPPSADEAVTERPDR